MNLQWLGDGPAQELSWLNYILCVGSKAGTESLEG